jgi:CBS domain-containing protein
MYRVKDVMTDEVASCGLKDSLETAVRMMSENACGSVPVVDANLHVVGVVTDRDAVLCALREGQALRDLRVEQAASREVVCCDVTDSLERAETLMRVNHVRRLPVLGAGRELVGVLSLTDLARYVELSPVEGCSGLSPRQIAVVLAETSGARARSSTGTGRSAANGARPIVELIFHG